MSINHSKYSLYSRLEIIFINGYQNFTKRFEEVIEKSKDKSWLQQILSPKYLPHSACAREHDEETGSISPSSHAEPFW